MARSEDIPEPTRSVVTTVECPRFDTHPFVEGPPLAQRRVAIISSAALIKRGDAPFHFGSTDFRTISADLPVSEILTSHVSINFDRSGFQRDINTAYPIERLKELAEEGVIGGVAKTHYTIMGSSDPHGMADSADQIAGQLRQEKIDSILLSPI
jgi:D-proline reductase (dithiol) PrdB